MKKKKEYTYIRVDITIDINVEEIFFNRLFCAGKSLLHSHDMINSYFDPCHVLLVESDWFIAFSVLF